MRIEAQRRAGRPTGQEASVLKLFGSNTSQALQTLSLDLEGLNGVAHDPDDRWAATTQYGFLRVRSATIAGGTSEIQRNILGREGARPPQGAGRRSRHPVEGRSTVVMGSS